MKTALISIYFKEQADECARLLKDAGWTILSTGGTAAFLNQRGVETTEISSLTNFPEILDGRVKTLHPAVFGPILAKTSADHLNQLSQHGMTKIDLVMVNFYPFEEYLAEGNLSMEQMIEKIDIGGPSMVRAAAKNFHSTTVIVDRADYLPVVQELVREGEIPLEKRKRLAQKAFSYTSFYDHLIAGYLHDEAELPAYFSLSGRKVQNLRYGENPHQSGALYAYDRKSPFFKPDQIQGKELSFNNILDAAMIYELTGDFSETRPFCAIVKHQNPCGAALGASLRQAYEKALAGDPRSAYGGIVAFNRTLDGDTAAVVAETFFEVILAPDFTTEALDILKSKKNLRLLRTPLGFRSRYDSRMIPGGFLLQDRDRAETRADAFQAKTDRPPSNREMADALFGWKLIKYVKSNAIILVRDEQLIGVGAGQMSRVDSVEIALNKCQGSPKDAILISDAYFPFADSIELAASRGITVAVEPGGSIRDEDVIAVSRKHNITLLFTGTRHFRH